MNWSLVLPSGEHILANDGGSQETDDRLYFECIASYILNTRGIIGGNISTGYTRSVCAYVNVHVSAVVPLCTSTASPPLDPWY